MINLKTFFKEYECFEFRLYGLDNNEELMGQTIDIDDLYKLFKDRLLQEMLADGLLEPENKRWKKPMMVDIHEYFSTKIVGINAAEQSKLFYDYWESLDWMVKKTRIKSWKGRANTWIKNYEKYKRDNQRENKEYDHESTEWGKSL